MKKGKTIHDRYHTPDVDNRNERLSSKEKGGLTKYQSGTRKKDRSIFKLW